LNRPLRFSSFFQSSKIRVSPTDIVSSFCPPRCCLSSDQRHHTVAPYHASFSLSQDELAASASSSDNALFRCLPSQTKTETLNPHHHRRLSSLDYPTRTLHCYKKIISILATLPITQPHLHFAFSLAKAPCHRNSTHRRHSLSPLYHAHRPPHNDTHNDKLVGHLSLPEQLIDM
jgi:hypothetical protein